MNARIKELREKLGLSQSDLGKALGIGRSAISRIESGTNALTETNIRLLCQQFNINRNWLETGNGNPFLSDDDAILTEIVNKYKLSALDKEAFKLYAQLDEHERRALISFAFSLTEKILENPVLYQEYKQAQQAQEVQHNTTQPYLTVLKSPEQSEKRKELERQARKLAETAYYQFLQEQEQASQASSARESDAG